MAHELTPHAEPAAPQSSCGAAGPTTLDLETTLNDDPQTTETARALLYRHGLPEDIVDGALCLHAQELAAAIRAETETLKAHGVLEPDKYRPCRDAANQIDPTCNVDDTDLTEADVDRMMAAGIPVQIVTTPPGTFAVDPNAPSLEFRTHDPAVPAVPVAAPPTGQAADRAAVSAALWAASEHHTVAEWICCDPIDPAHALCVQGGAALRMLKALLVDDPEAWKPAPLLDEVMRLVPPAGTATEAHRLALSEALNLGTGAPWDAIYDRATELGLPPLDRDPVAQRLGLLPPPADQAAVYAEVADRLAADAEQGDKEGFTRIYRRSAAKQVREWGEELRRPAAETGQPETQAAASPSNRRALVHNAITDALSAAGDWVPHSVRIAATRAALAEVDAWHADGPVSADAAPAVVQADGEATP